MSDAGFELRPWVSLPMGPTIERASEGAIRTGFDERAAHPSVRAVAPCAMIRSDEMVTFLQRLALALPALAHPQVRPLSLERRSP